MRANPRFLGWIGVVGVLLTVTGCGVPRPADQWLSITRDSFRLTRGKVKLAPIPEADSSLATLAATEDTRDPIVSKLNGSDPDFNSDHPTVNDFVNNFSNRSRGSFERALDRSGRYVPEMIPILEEQGVPAELAYLPLIESGFRTNARSHAGAVGPWQFVRSTGKRYGLRVDWYVDERRDPIKSTQAAARYLRTLYDMFDSWQLALAAYNTGEGTVARVMERRGADNFWEMMEKGYLHPETCSFVPLFLAALQIARAPEEHGFEPPQWEWPQSDLVHVERSVSLRAIAQMTGTSVSEIQKLNPALVRGATPPDGYDVRLPPGTERAFAVAYADMLREGAKDPYLASTKPGTYRVRRGDTPSTIARRFGVSVNELMYANGWGDARLVRAGALARIPGAGRAEVAASGKYKIRAGDTPSAIAQRFGVSVQALMRANGWRDATRIRAGAIARVPGRSTSVAVAKAASTKTVAAAERTYKVRPGDTPIAIAARFGISVPELMRANGWKDARGIRAGEEARIPARSKPASAGKRDLAAAETPSDPQITYRIRSGDTPSLIARRFGVTVGQLMAANDWNDPRRIRAGEVARIPYRDDESVRLASRLQETQDNLN